MKPADKIKELISKSDVQTASGTDKRILGGALDHLEKLKHKKSAPIQPNIWRTIMKSPITKFAAAAMIIIAVLIGIYHFGGFVDGSSVAWGEVAERFRSVPFFSAAIYIREDALARPEQFELWMGQGGQTRMRVAAQIIFSRQSQVNKAFDLRKRQEVEPNPRAVEILEMLEPNGRYSIETVIRIISGGKLIDVTPLVNTDAVIQQDLVVFDVQSEVSPEWVRIYALRKSKLPVGIRIWNPRDGGCIDVLITYSKDQPDIFFDAQTFAAKLADSSNTPASLAYMFLKDPGGRIIIRKDP